MTKRLATKKDLLKAYDTDDCTDLKKCYVLKFATASGRPPLQSNMGAYELPKPKRPGKWMTVEPPIVICCNGYHGFVANEGDFNQWESSRLFIAEIAGDVTAGYNKFAAEKLRLVREVPVLRGRLGAPSARLTLREARRIVDELNAEKGE